MNKILGFGVTELLMVLALMAILLAIGIPIYTDAIEKQRVSNNAEQISAFISSLKSESIKRNKFITTSYSMESADNWCIGGSIGDTFQDCIDERSDNVWMLKSIDTGPLNSIEVEPSSGSFTYDPVRGILTNPEDELHFTLKSKENKFILNVNVVASGDVVICLSRDSMPVPEYGLC